MSAVRSLDKVGEVRSSHVEYDVWLTGDSRYLEPITLRLGSGGMSVQDYLTPEEARSLATLLVAAARLAEAQS